MGHTKQNRLQHGDQDDNRDTSPRNTAQDCCLHLWGKLLSLSTEIGHFYLQNFICRDFGWHKVEWVSEELVEQLPEKALLAFVSLAAHRFQVVMQNIDIFFVHEIVAMYCWK